MFFTSNEHPDPHWWHSITTKSSNERNCSNLEDNIMVAVDVSSSSRNSRSLIRQQQQGFLCKSWIWILIILPGLFLLWLSILQGSQWMVEQSNNSTEYVMKNVVPISKDSHHFHVLASTSTCPVTSISDLSDNVRNPTIGTRWIVVPPSEGDDLHLMCCETTKGSLSILLHSAWAPLGVTHLLNMLRQGYFEQDIPLFRCTDACQFGLSSNTTLTKQFDPNIPDDPLWLPTGPQHQFVNGIPRYPQGVLTHAGSGPNTRSNQFVITLKPNKFMGGGSTWEVPLGEVVVGRSETEDHDQINVLHRLYTGYGEKGPSQAMLRKAGITMEIMEKWPLMDYIHRCRLVDSRMAGLR
jgi:cyclophilin family peptidyl-prolyl cis-trans isomerase